MPNFWDPGLEPGDDEHYPDIPFQFEDDPAVTDVYVKGIHGRTESIRAFLKTQSHENIAARCARIIDYMAEEEEMDLMNFLWYVTWGLNISKNSINYGKIRYMLTSVLHSDMLPEVLEKWYRPPRRHQQGIATRGARAPMERWAEENVTTRMNNEMKALIPLTISPPDELSEESLLSFSLSKMHADFEEAAPLTWRILFAAASTPLQLKRSKKDHAPSVCTIMSMLSFSRSHHRCRLQKYLSVYFASCGLAAKANDLTNALGLTMSQSWKYEALESLSATKHAAMERDLRDEGKQSVASYDNLNIKFQKIEQRLDNQNHFDSGCAATVFVIENPQLPLPNVDAYREQWQRESRNPITAGDILKLDDLAAERIFAFNKWRVLDFLLNAPKFDREKYRSRNNSLFHRPTPVQQLPTGKQFVHTQYILDTAHIEEVSLEGNLRCLDEWFRQLKLSTDEEQKKLSHKKLWLWMGDQLTVSRIRSLQQLRARELNWWHRLEHLVPFFGWLHAQMAQEESIHKQHYATGTGGLKHAFDLLKRKGLHAAAVQGNFHQRVHEAYYHILEAHIRDLWEAIGEVKDLSELRDKTPQELDKLATRILDEFASTLAYHRQTRKPLSRQDHVLQNQILFVRDLLDYVNLDDAIRTGDVGRMFDLMPRLLFRYHGGNNWKYTIEVLESLQGLQREFPPDFRAYVLYYCWIACTNDGENFVSHDMLQERNVRDLKSTFSVHGPYATWEYIKRISASIPTLRKVKDHTEAEFNHFYRGKSHTSPQKEKDVARLQLSYKSSNIHVYTPGRHLTEARRAKDFLATGSDVLKLQGTIDRWAERRLTNRSLQEIWEDPEPEVAIDQVAESDEDMLAVGEGPEPQVVFDQGVDYDEDMYADGDLWHDIDVVHEDEEA